MSLLLEACRMRTVERTPVWFMRQAGRYMPEYRRVRANHSILEICKRPDLAAEVTLQPIEVLNVDAAIIFADLLLPLEPMGLSLEFLEGDGPTIHNPLRSSQDIDKLETQNGNDLSYVGEAIAKVKKALDGRVPNIGFTGAPFTLASYMIEGGSSRNFALTKSLMYSGSPDWERLMEKILKVIVPYAINQVTSGADIIQVFDSWVGALAPQDYRRYVLPHSQMLIRQIQATGVPVIHFATGAGTFLPLLHEAGGDVLGLDWRVRLDEAWSAIQYQAAVQGNLDPATLFAPLPEIEERVKSILQHAGKRPGHIFNLGHGILPETPVENVKAVVRMVRNF